MNEPQVSDASAIDPPPPNRPLTGRRHPLVRYGVPAVALALIVGAIVVLRQSPGSSGTNNAELSQARLGALEGGSPQVGQPAPDFALSTLDGQVIRLSDLRGRVVLVNFWATWCGPCRAEMPDLQAVYEQNQSDLVVLSVNAEGTSAAEARRLATDFRDELGLTFPIVLDTPGGDVFSQYKLQGLPDSFFVDASGVIRSLSIGPMNRDTIQKKLEQTRKGS